MIDQDALDTGRVYLCTLATNGEVRSGCYIRPQVILREWWVLVSGLGFGVDILMAEKDGWMFGRRPTDPNGV